MISAARFLVAAAVGRTSGKSVPPIDNGTYGSVGSIIYGTSTTATSTNQLLVQ